MRLCVSREEVDETMPFGYEQGFPNQYAARLA